MSFYFLWRLKVLMKSGHKEESDLDVSAPPAALR